MLQISDMIRNFGDRISAEIEVDQFGEILCFFFLQSKPKHHFRYLTVRLGNDLNLLKERFKTSLRSLKAISPFGRASMFIPESSISLLLCSLAVVVLCFVFLKISSFAMLDDTAVWKQFYALFNECANDFVLKRSLWYPNLSDWQFCCLFFFIANLFFRAPSWLHCCPSQRLWVTFWVLMSCFAWQLFFRIPASATSFFLHCLMAFVVM